MKAMTYLVELQEPLLATTLQGEPNSSESLPYIPGSLLRGMWIDRYQQQHGPVNDLARHETCRRLFFDSSTRYLHAYPYAPAVRARVLPAPRSLRRFKNERVTESNNHIFDASNTDWKPDKQRKHEQKDSLKPVDVPFCRFSSENNRVIFYTPDRTLTIHTQRDPKMGRARKERGRGEIFRYEALEAGQWFQGVILIDDDQDVETLCDLLKQTSVSWLGRSRSAGYGRVRFHFDAAMDLHSSWREIGGTAPDLSANTRCTMTLLSDALLYDSDGQPVTAPDKETLAATLNLPEEQVKLLDHDHTFTDSALRGGFNRAWRLPLPQSYTLTAGSVITFELTRQLDAQEVSQLEARGIGARRAEGYGRIAFNWHTTLQFTSGEKGSIAQPYADGEQKLNAVEQQMARRMAQRLLDAQIERAILTYMKDTKVTPSPQPSQLNRLRTVARQNIAQGSLGAREVLEQFEKLKPTARQQFERARVGRAGNTLPFDRWIRNLLQEPTRFLHEDLNLRQRKAVAGQIPELDDKLTAQTVLRLLAAVLEKTVREKQQEGERKEQPV
ncbi:MAG: RAMP superfamily CRISPR-associated protein [Roseiflexaceae bacterium]